MKIAYLSTFYPFRGGIAQFNANLTMALRREHEVVPFTFKRQYPSLLFPGKTQYVTSDDKAVQIDSIAALDTANPLTYGATARRIAAVHPDVLLMKYWMSYFAPSLGFVARRLRRRGCRPVAILDNVLPHERRFFDKPLTRWFLRQCDGFVCMSEAVRDDLLSLKADARYVMLPHPLYDHFGQKTDRLIARERLGIAPDKKTVLFFGLIRDYKGLDLLIDAFARLDDSYQLVIAGESYSDFGRYSRQIDSSPAKTRIATFVRYIADDEVPLLFSAADLLTLPYRSATQSGVIPIAYHFELPVIATDVGGLRETIENADTGLVCQPNVESLALSIQQFFTAGAARFIENIRQEKTRLTWDKFADRLMNFVEK